MRWMRCPQVLFLLSLIKNQTGKMVSWYTFTYICAWQQHTQLHTQSMYDRKTRRTRHYACAVSRSIQSDFLFLVKQMRCEASGKSYNKLHFLRMDFQFPNERSPMQWFSNFNQYVVRCCMRNYTENCVVVRRRRSRNKNPWILSINCECNFHWRR